MRNLFEDQVDLVMMDYQPVKAFVDGGAGKLILKNRRGRVLLTYGLGQAVPLEGQNGLWQPTWMLMAPWSAQRLVLNRRLFC